MSSAAHAQEARDAIVKADALESSRGQDVELEAQAVFLTGKRAFEDGRFADALVAFHRAYALTRHSALLFDVALAADRLRDDPAALDAFERYLRAEPRAPDREQIEQRIAALRAAIERRERERDTGVAASLSPAEAAASLQMKDPSAPSGALARDDGDAAESDATIFERWWFWTAIGAVAAGGVIAAIALHEPAAERPTTPSSGLLVMTLGAAR